MAKRFTDTDKYKKPFVRGLQGAYKLLWDYLYHDCNHAGIWIVDFDIAQIYLGNDMPVNNNDALKYFNNGEKRIIEIEGKTKWFIPGFIEFQYGVLNPKNKAHNSVINILSKYNLYKNNKVHTSPLKGAKDKDKDKELDKEELKDKAFEKWWPTYPMRNGKRVGKQDAKEKFLKLDFLDYDNLKKATDNYSSEELPKDASRFLKKDYWKDWIEKRQEKDKKQSNEAQIRNTFKD